MKIRIWSLVLVLFTTATISAQNVNRYLKSPLPQEWLDASQSNGTNSGSDLFQQTLPTDDQWWKLFGDSTLDSLIAQAVDRNYSVLMAINRMNIAKYNVRIARSSFFPTVNLGAGWTKEQTSGRMSKNVPQEEEDYFNAALNVSWEIDIFGSIRKRVKAEKETFMASKEEYLAVMVSLSAQVASAYINLRESQQELEVVIKNCQSQKEVLNITEARYNAGLASKLDVAQAKSVYYSTKASIPLLETDINQYINSIAVLLGAYPDEIKENLSSIKSLPDYMTPIGVGIPADLILRRPDIRSAERQVNAQAASLGATKSDWLPQVYVKGSAGFISKNLNSEFINHKSFTYEIAPSLSWNIFTGGKLINTTKQARIQLDESINQYNETILNAVQEVDNAMNAYKNYIKQIVALREVCYQGQETLNLSINLYKEGLSPFQNVVDAQKSLLTYQNQLVQAQGGTLLQLISLYQALGGGWNNIINE